MKIFVHTNHKQILGAHVAKYCFERNTSHPGTFSVELISLKDYPELNRRQGQKYFRKGIEVEWDNEDLQSFTPLRFLPAQLMGYEGRAVVVDPDVFAVGDAYELLTMDMQGKAIMCRCIAAQKDSPAYFASSVMLLDCGKLGHWRWAEAIDEMFAGERDYRDWISLYLEDPESIGCLGEQWNSFDKLTRDTKFLHTTGRATQPWKTGLPIDFSKKEKPPKAWKKLRKCHLVPNPKTPMGRKVLDAFRRRAPVRARGFYRPHPDKGQEDFFFSMVAECLDKSVITEDFVSSEIAKGHVRKDAFEVIERFRERKGVA